MRDETRDKLMIREDLQQIPPEHIIFSTPQKVEEHAPLWVKIFGGSLVSIAFLCVITLTGYIVSNINSLQTQINVLNTESVSKKEFHENMKIHNDSIQSSKESIAGYKERLLLAETQATQYREECKQFQKELQALRERLAAIESKK